MTPQPQHSDETLVKKFAGFLREIGIPVEYGNVAGSFLPGIAVKSGGLVIDQDGLGHPGDILHEAGHLALAPAEIRAGLSGEVVIPGESPQVIEAAAMCWSYAACIHLDVDPRVVFHEHGYHGRGQAILQNFAFGVFPGLQALVSFRMTSSPDNFPVMDRWLRS